MKHNFCEKLIIDEVLNGISIIVFNILMGFACSPLVPN